LQELLYCGSAGLPCLLAAASPEIYLSSKSNLLRPPVFPSTELEFDFRGEVQVGQALDSIGHASVDVGGKLWAWRDG